MSTSSRFLELCKKQTSDNFVTIFSLDEGTDPEDTILNAFKMFDPDAKGYVRTAE